MTAENTLTLLVHRPVVGQCLVAASGRSRNAAAVALSPTQLSHAQIRQKGYAYAVADAAGQRTAELAAETVVAAYYNGDEEDALVAFERAVRAGAAAAQGKVSPVATPRERVRARLPQLEAGVAAVLCYRRGLVASTAPSGCAYRIRGHSIHLVGSVNGAPSPLVHRIPRQTGPEEDGPPVSLMAVELRAGDRIVLGTAALSTLVQPGEILELVCRLGPRRSAEAVVDLARRRGWSDALSAVVVTAAPPDPVPGIAEWIDEERRLDRLASPEPSAASSRAKPVARRSRADPVPAVPASPAPSRPAATPPGPAPAPPRPAPAPPRPAPSQPAPREPEAPGAEGRKAPSRADGESAPVRAVAATVVPPAAPSPQDRGSAPGPEAPTSGGGEEPGSAARAAAAALAAAAAARDAVARAAAAAAPRRREPTIAAKEASVKAVGPKAARVPVHERPPERAAAEYAAAESAAVDSAAVESAAVESAAVESAAVESAAVEAESHVGAPLPSDPSTMTLGEATDAQAWDIVIPPWERRPTIPPLPSATGAGTRPRVAPTAAPATQRLTLGIEVPWRLMAVAGGTFGALALAFALRGQMAGAALAVAAGASDLVSEASEAATGAAAGAAGAGSGAWRMLREAWPDSGGADALAVAPGLVASATPSRTPLPPPTYTPYPTYTPIPTYTPVPTPDRPEPPAAPRPEVSSGITLVAPGASETILGCVAFAWQMSRPLNAGEGFSLLVCTGALCTPRNGISGDAPPVVWDPADTRGNPDLFGIPGIYRWAVAAVDSGGEVVRSPPQAFAWAGGACGDRSSGGDDGGPKRRPKPTPPPPLP